jgi:hypothetical protein
LNKKSQGKSPATKSAENESTAGPSSARPRTKQLPDSTPGKLVLVKKALEPRAFGTWMSDDVVEGAIGPILRGGEQRVALLDQLRKAVKAGDKKLVFEIAERYCGLTA